MLLLFFQIREFCYRRVYHALSFYIIDARMCTWANNVKSTTRVALIPVKIAEYAILNQMVSHAGNFTFHVQLFKALQKNI